MSVLTSVLEKLRGKRQDQIKSAWQRYQEMVVALSNEEQIDVDELAVVMDQLDRSDKDLEADIDNRRQRVELAKALSEREAIVQQIPKLEQTHEAARAELDQAIAKLRPKISDAYNALHAAQLRTVELSYVEAKLISTCQDPQIAEAEAAIAAERKEVSDKIRAIQFLGSQTPRGDLDRLIETIAENRRKMPDKNESPTFWREASKALEALERQAEQMRPHVEKFDADYAALKQQDAELTRRQAALNRRKMVP